MRYLIPLLLAHSVSAQNIDWTKINEETLKHYSALVQIDSTDPPGNETKVVDYVRKVLDAEGIPYIIAAKDPARANLIARLKGNGSKKPIADHGPHGHRESGCVEMDLSSFQRDAQRRLYLRPRHAGRQGQSNCLHDDDGAAEALGHPARS